MGFLHYMYVVGKSSRKPQVAQGSPTQSQSGSGNIARELAQRCGECERDQVKTIYPAALDIEAPCVRPYLRKSNP